MLAVELHEGDLLYIPRGWPHQAVAAAAHPAPSTLHQVRGSGSRSGTKTGSGPRSSTPLQPSLHITFGVEVDEAFTWAAVVHSAVAYAAAAAAAAQVPQQHRGAAGNAVGGQLQQQQQGGATGAAAAGAQPPQQQQQQQRCVQGWLEMVAACQVCEGQG